MLRGDRAWTLSQLQQLWGEGWHDLVEDVVQLYREWGLMVSDQGVRDPMQRDLYPKDWDAIAQQVKSDADWHCEQCGKACIRPGETITPLLSAFGRSG